MQQEAFLFDASVGHNVAYADPWAEDERIVGATKTAQIHEHIAGLPAAYETRVGERGVALSGGQRQRMSIARGVVPGPGVMIFDDFTAAIDAVTERKVRDGLAKATRTKATVIIAHRLSSLMHADEIVVLDEGRVVERGSHAELLAHGGENYDLSAPASNRAARTPARRPPQGGGGRAMSGVTQARPLPLREKVSSEGRRRGVAPAGPAFARPSAGAPCRDPSSARSRATSPEGEGKGNVFERLRLRPQDRAAQLIS